MAGKKETIEYYQDKRGEWRWRMLDGDGKVVGAACEGYNARDDCEKNAKRGKNAKDSWEFYEDRAGHWRWRRTASNGKIVGASPAGYGSKDAAVTNASRQGYSA